LGGVALSISSQGHIQSINSIAHSDGGDGVPKHVIARSLSELRSSGADLERLLGVPRSSGFAHTLIDRTGQVTSIELTATQHRVTRPRTTFVHTNHLLDPALNPRGLVASDSSLDRFTDATALARPAMDRTSMMRLLEDQSRGKSKSILNKNTIARAIVDFDTRTAYFWLKQEKEKGWVPYSIDFFFQS
jgi:predicted choloylglycine hydrolase